MTNEQEWQLIYYSDVHEKSPIREFIAGLDNKTQARLEWSLQRLQVLNVQAREPLVKHIEGKIWELRRESDTNIYRVFYFFFTGRQIVLLHGFQKKTEKTPRREVEIAEQRMIDYIEREGRDEDD